MINGAWERTDHLYCERVKGGWALSCRDDREAMGILKNI